MKSRSSFTNAVRTSITSASLGSLIIMAGCASSSWTQWGGPTRDFVTESRIQSADWGDAGPKRVWERELGEGYSAITLDNDHLYTTYRSGDEEAIIALDARSGRTIWEHRYAAPLIEGVSDNFGTGPAATPVVLDDRVCTLGRMGMLQCVSKSDGSIIWAHDLISELGAKVPQFGFASSPIVYDGKLVALVGGEGTGVMAFDVSSGSLLWKQHSFENIYASLLPINVAGQNQLVGLVSDEVVGLDATNGDLLWRFPHVNQWKTSVCTPVWDGHDTLFVSSGGEAGARGLRLTRNGDKTDVAELWSSKKLAIDAPGNAVRIGDIVYATTGSPALLAAVDIHTGDIAWRQRDMPGSRIVVVGGKLLILDDEGKLTLATPRADGVTIDAEAQLLEKPAWTAPTVVGKRAFIRDRKTIMALDMG